MTSVHRASKSLNPLNEDYLEIFEGTDYNLVLTKVNTIYENASKKKKESNEEKCPHSNIDVIDGNNICQDCGVVIEELSYEKEWRYYGSTDNKSNKDPSRCNKGKTQQRNIFKDVEGMNFPESIVKLANRDFQTIVGDDIYRSDKRKGIICACVFHTYYNEGEIYTSDYIGQKFNIRRQCISDGMEKYHETFPESRNINITAKDLVRFLLKEAGIPLEPHLNNIKSICAYLENRSSLLNRSSPQSVSAGIIYLYLCLMTKLKDSLGLSKIKFSKLVQLSDITVGKIAKEVAKILLEDKTIKI